MISTLLPRRTALRLTSLLLFVVGWELLAPRTSGLLFPSFTETMAALIQLLGSPVLWHALWLSNQALLVGFLLAATMGISLGLGLARALSGMVAAELLVVAVGVGRLILDFQGNFETAHCFAAVLCVAVQAVGLTEGTKWLERRLFPWCALGEGQ